MSAYSEYSKMFREGIVAKARELNYSAENLCILEGNITLLREQFPNTYSNLMSCLHNRDSRQPMDYAKDLVASWIFEDTIVQKLSEYGIATTLAGADSNRELLPCFQHQECLQVAIARFPLMGKLAFSKSCAIIQDGGKARATWSLEMQSIRNCLARRRCSSEYAQFLKDIFSWISLATLMLVTYNPIVHTAGSLLIQ